MNRETVGNLSLFSNSTVDPSPIKGLKSKLKSLFPWPTVYFKSRRLFFRRDSALLNLGWFHSILNGYPCNVDGSPLPWMNYSMIHFLQNRLRKDLRLFEYGSGYSTLFFGDRVAEVTAVEHDPEWQRIISSRLADNATVIHQTLEDKDEYCQAVLRSGQLYDVIVVDGRERSCCASHACKALSERGVIIWDDSDRPKYQEGIRYLLEKGFLKLDFQGLKPIDHAAAQTSIFYRPNNCFGI